MLAVCYMSKTQSPTHHHTHLHSPTYTTDVCVQMHAVCYMSKYGSKDVAQRQKDGLASLGVFFDIGVSSISLYVAGTLAWSLRAAIA